MSGFSARNSASDRGQDLPDLVREPRAAHAQVAVRLAHPEVAEEHAAEAVVVVLAGVDQDVLTESSSSGITR